MKVPPGAAGEYDVLEVSRSVDDRQALQPEYVPAVNGTWVKPGKGRVLRIGYG